MLSLAEITTPEEFERRAPSSLAWSHGYKDSLLYARYRAAGPEEKIPLCLQMLRSQPPGHRELAERARRADAPLILYMNNGAHVVAEMVESGADVISLDWRADLASAAQRFGRRVSLQGNLDPCWLAAPREQIAEMVRDIAKAAAPARGHILNLGHGCLPETPVEGVRAFTDAARALA